MYRVERDPWNFADWNRSICLCQIETDPFEVNWNRSIGNGLKQIQLKCQVETDPFEMGWNRSIYIVKLWSSHSWVAYEEVLGLLEMSRTSFSLWVDMMLIEKVRHYSGGCDRRSWAKGRPWPDESVAIERSMERPNEVHDQQSQWQMRGLWDQMDG